MLLHWLMLMLESESNVLKLHHLVRKLWVYHSSLNLLYGFLCLLTDIACCTYQTTDCGILGLFNLLESFPWGSFQMFAVFFTFSEHDFRKRSLVMPLFMPYKPHKKWIDLDSSRVVPNKLGADRLELSCSVNILLSEWPNKIFF